MKEITPTKALLKSLGGGARGIATDILGVARKGGGKLSDALERALRVQDEMKQESARRTLERMGMTPEMYREQFLSSPEDQAFWRDQLDPVPRPLRGLRDRLMNIRSNQ